MNQLAGLATVLAGKVVCVCVCVCVSVCVCVGSDAVTRRSSSVASKNRIIQRAPADCHQGRHAR